MRRQILVALGLLALIVFNGAICELVGHGPNALFVVYVWCGVSGVAYGYAVAR